MPRKSRNKSENTFLAILALIGVWLVSVVLMLFFVGCGVWVVGTLIYAFTEQAWNFTTLLMLLAGIVPFFLGWYITRRRGGDFWSLFSTPF